ncbi:hypothetical protein FGRMN_1698 [Fusarium graminum]|nr:hypothetical protein FGRMN_1698 [Fusarium graminum]
MSLLGEQDKGTPVSGFIAQLSAADLDLDILGRTQVPQLRLPRNLQQTPVVVGHNFLTIAEAQTLLDNYRTKAVQHFPFIPIASDIAASSLKETKPFLFMSIMATMKFDNCTIQRQMGEEVRIQAHQRVLLESESSLELLQGLLVYLAWYQYFFSYEKQQIVQIAQLCVSLVHSLGLDQNPTNTRRKVDLGPDETALGRKAARTTDQLRALLGTYCTASWVSTKFRTRCAIPHTGYIKQSCELLSTNPEYTTDPLISYFVRVNELSRRICDTFGYDDLENSGIRSEFVSAMALQTLSREAVLLKASIPPMLQDNFALKLELYLLDTLIGEVALHEDFWDRSMTDNLFNTGNASIFPNTRVSILFDLFRSCKSLNETVMQCPDEELWYITFYTTAKVCRTLSCLSNAGKISTEILRWIASSSGGPFITGGLVPPMHNATTIERAADLEGEAKRLRNKFKSLSHLVQNAGNEADIMYGFSDMIWAVVVAYEHTRGVEASPLNFSVISDGQGTSNETSSSGGYLSSIGSGHIQSDAMLDFEVFKDGTWEELLAGIATASE